MTLGEVLIKTGENSLLEREGLGGRPVSDLLKRLGVLVGQADAAALFGPRTAKAEVCFGAGVSILSHAARSSSAISPSSGGPLIFFKKRAKVSFLAPVYVSNAGSREISVLERDALAGQLKHVETVAVNGTAKDRARQEPELGRDHRLALTYQASAERHTAGERTSGFGRPSNVSKWRFPKFASAQESRSSVLNPGAELTVIDAATACSSATNPATAGLRCSPLRNVTKMRRRIAGRISFNSNVPI